MPLTHDEVNALFAEVSEEWNQAEEIVKAAEQICSEAVFPSIKEFRYAGRRLIDSFGEMANGNDRAVIEGFVKDAVFNCHCARHDAIDVATATIASNLEIVVSKIGYDIVLKAFPEFADLRRRLAEVRGKIRQSRVNRTDRNVIYQTIHNVDLPALASLYDQFQGAEDIMKSLASRERGERLFLRVTTVVAIIVAIVSATWPIFHKDEPGMVIPPGSTVITPVVTPTQ